LFFYTSTLDIRICPNSCPCAVCCFCKCNQCRGILILVSTATQNSIESRALAYGTFMCKGRGSQQPPLNRKRACIYCLWVLSNNVNFGRSFQGWQSRDPTRRGRSAMPEVNDFNRASHLAMTRLGMTTSHE